MTGTAIRFVRHLSALVALVGAVSVPAYAAPSPITAPFTVAPLSLVAQPNAARGADGSYIVAWLNQASVGDNFSVPHVRVYRRDGSPVGPDVEIGNFGSIPVYEFDIAAAGNGSFVIAYQQFHSSTNSYGIRVQRLSPLGSPIGSAVNIRDFPADRAGANGISVAAARDGRFVVTWEDYAERYLTPPVRFPVIQVMDSTQARVFNADGSPLTDEIVVHREFFRTTARSTPPHAPEIAMNADGEFVVVRESIKDDDRSLFARRFRADGSPLGIERRVTPYGNGDIIERGVTIADNGNFVVGWGAGFPDQQLFFRRFNAEGVALAAPQTILTESPASRFSLSGDAQGNFTAVWIGPDLVGRSYTSAGIARGGRFSVDSSAGFRDLPVVASDPLGNFGVAWANRVLSAGVPGSAESIQSQLFSAP